MSATRNLHYLIFYIFIFTLFQSCNDNREIENTYSIINKIINENLNIKKEINFNPPPIADYSGKSHKLTVSDSLKLYENFYNQTIKKKLIAVYPNMFLPKNIVNFEECTIDRKFELSFYNLKKGKSIDLKKINLFRNDSLVYYSNNYKNKNTRGFDEIDICYNFSRIKFNKKFDKAIIIVGLSFSKLDGFSTLYYLEKKGIKWYIKCSKGLSIS